VITLARRCAPALALVLPLLALLLVDRHLGWLTTDIVRPVWSDVSDTWSWLWQAARHV
jgi:hypothetical protein